jgi:hypothetical protein
LRVGGKVDIAAFADLNYSLQEGKVADAEAAAGDAVVWADGSVVFACLALIPPCSIFFKFSPLPL